MPNLTEPYVHPVTYAVLTGATSGEELVKQYEAGERDFSGFDLVGARLGGANLSGIDLRGAYLSMADLSGANLTDANLKKAFLDRAKLHRANLSRANLTDSNLHSAKLIEANLYEANLSNAELHNTDISSANFQKANIVGSEFEGVNVKDADLRGVCLCCSSLPGLSIRQLFHALELGKFYAPRHVSSQSLNTRARFATFVLFLLVGSLVGGGYMAYGASITDTASQANVPVPAFVSEMIMSAIAGFFAGAVVGFATGLSLNLIVWPEIAMRKKIEMLPLMDSEQTGQL